jgi:hypothetical protein
MPNDRPYPTITVRAGRPPLAAFARSSWASRTAARSARVHQDDLLVVLLL